MPRTKGGYVTKRRRNRILKLAKGYFGSKHTLYRTAKQQVMKSLSYAYRDRKRKKRDFRKLWISRINAAARINGLSYSKLMYGLKLNNILVNRKVLADLAINNTQEFANLCKLALEPVAKLIFDKKSDQISKHLETVRIEQERKEAVSKNRLERAANR